MAEQSRPQGLPHPTRKDIAGAVPIASMKVAIAYAAHDHCDSWFAYDLAQLTAYTAMALISSGMDVEFGVEAVVGTHIPRARHEILKSALEENVSHLLWVDSDQRFPKDAALRLMGHNKPYVGVNCSTRGIPPRYTAIKKVGGDLLRTTPDSTGIEEVEAVGFACTLMDLRLIGDVIRHMPMPWFVNQYDNKRSKWIGNDVRFCQLLRKAGVPIHVDHDLSKEIGHTGTRTYWTLDVAEWEKLTNGADE